MSDLTSSGPYIAWIVSAFPNNQCELCSYYLPKWARDTSDRRYFADGGTCSVLCPSCGRSCRKLFLLEKESLEVVPDSYQMRMWRDPNILLPMPCPSNPRSCYDHEAWIQEIKDYIKVRPAVSNPTSIRKEDPPEKAPEELKVFKRRIVVE